MDFSHYSDDTVQVAVDLVNTHEVFGGTDSIDDLAGLSAFLDDSREQWVGAQCWVTEPTDRDLAEVKVLRERLRSVFDAQTREEAAEVLNELLRSTGATPHVSLHGEGPHLHFEPGSGSIADRLGAATAMGLSVVLCDYGFERFGVCQSSTCEDAFIDTSKNKSKRHCSTSCSNRENVAAHRRRARVT